jgi:hypothetical protein
MTMLLGENPGTYRFLSFPGLLAQKTSMVPDFYVIQVSGVGQGSVKFIKR